MQPHTGTALSDCRPGVRPGACSNYTRAFREPSPYADPALSCCRQVEDENAKTAEGEEEEEEEPAAPKKAAASSAPKKASVLKSAAAADDEEEEDETPAVADGATAAAAKAAKAAKAKVLELATKAADK